MEPLNVILTTKPNYSLLERILFMTMTMDIYFFRSHKPLPLTYSICHKCLTWCPSRSSNYAVIRTGKFCIESNGSLKIASISTHILYYCPFDLTVNMVNTKSKTSFFDFPFHIFRNKFVPFFGNYRSIGLLLLLRNIPNRNKTLTAFYILTIVTRN